MAEKDKDPLATTIAAIFDNTEIIEEEDHTTSEESSPQENTVDNDDNDSCADSNTDNDNESKLQINKFGFIDAFDYGNELLLKAHY